MKPNLPRLLSLAAALTTVLCHGLFAASPYTADANTLALWRFDETTNPPTVYADVSGNSVLQLVKTGAGDLQSVSGLLGNAVTGFHPQTSTINPRLLLNSNASPTNPSVQTFEVWVRFDAASYLPHETPTGTGWSNNQMIFRRAGSRVPIQFYFTDDNTGENSSLTLEIRNAAGVSKKLAYELGHSVERNRWYHVAYSIQQTGADVIAKLYFQDEFGGYATAPAAASATFAGFTYDTGVFPISIGEAGQTGYDPFTGTIDEARLSNVARTSFTTHPALATQFPSITNGRIHLLGGDCRGFGILATTNAGGLKAVYLKRTTTVPVNEFIKPRPVTLARVLDPTGKIIALADLSDDPTGQTERVIPVPSGPSGIYTVNIIGGRSSDLVSVGLPSTALKQGVRGEFSLGFPSLSADRDYYLYLPRTYTQFRMFVYGSATQTIQLFSGATYATEVGSIGGSSSVDVWNSSLSRYELTIASTLVPASTSVAPSVIRIRIPAGFDKTLVFDGVPGLLCADAPSAIEFAGGTLEAAGLLVGGPLQKRTREWMQTQHLANSNYTVTLDFPTSVSSGLPNPPLQALPYGKGGFLNGLQAGIARQVLNVNSGYFGANLPPTDARPSWETFQYGGLLSIYDALAMTGAGTLPFATVSGKKINPAHLNANVLRRAMLYAFYHFTSMDGAHLIREGNMATSSYPFTHSFFVYYQAAQSYYLLSEAGQITAEPSAIWRDCLLAFGDKHADFRGYQSNQWGHMMLGHLYTYLSTDEPRFLKWFEEQFATYVDGGYGTNAKFGLHPAGYFLEEYGPDGNYDSMNLYVVVEAYLRYRELPEADLVLVEKMRQTIEDNLAFKSFVWLPQPGGEVLSPTALNTRIAATPMSTMAYPGISMARFEFPLALKRQLLRTVPVTGPGDASTFPHFISTDTWAINFLNWALPIKDTGFTDITNPGGSWTASIHHAYQLPQTATAAALPCENATDATWDLPGLTAWKKGSLYGATFYAVSGGKATVGSKLGGGPTTIWSPQTGALILSSQNSQSPIGSITAESHLTHSSVYWTTSGTLYSSGRMNNATAQWLTPGTVYKVTETTAADGTSRTISWTYDFTNSASPTLTVAVSPLPAGLKINLPIYSNASDGVSEVLSVATAGTFTFTGGGKVFGVTWPGGTTATLTTTDVSTVKRVAIPMATSPMVLTMTLN